MRKFVRKKETIFAEALVIRKLVSQHVIVVYYNFITIIEVRDNKIVTARVNYVLDLSNLFVAVYFHVWTAWRFLSTGKCTSLKMYLWIHHWRKRKGKIITEDRYCFLALFCENKQKRKIEKETKKKESIFKIYIQQILYDYGFIIETYFWSTKLLRWLFFESWLYARILYVYFINQFWILFSGQVNYFRKVVWDDLEAILLFQIHGSMYTESSFATGIYRNTRAYYSKVFKQCSNTSSHIAIIFKFFEESNYDRCWMQNNFNVTQN